MILRSRPSTKENRISKLACLGKTGLSKDYPDRVQMGGNKIVLACMLSCFAAPAVAAPNGNGPPLVIKSQGSFAAGGTVLTQPGTFDPTSSAPVGQTLYGDHS